MNRGHKPGQIRSLKVIRGPACEIRERLLAAYWNSEEGTAKHLNLFKTLHAHEKKHGWSLPNLGYDWTGNFGPQAESKGTRQLLVNAQTVHLAPSASLAGKSGVTPTIQKIC